MAVKGERTSRNRRYRDRKMKRTLTIRVKGYLRDGKKIKPHTRKLKKNVR